MSQYVSVNETVYVMSELSDVVRNICICEYQCYKSLNCKIVESGICTISNVEIKYLFK